MNTAAPSVPQSPAPARIGVAERLHPSDQRLAQMAPGRLFQRPCDPHRILALLSHADHTTCTTREIWCVVIAVGAHARGVIGEIVAFPRDEHVVALRVVGPMQLARA